MLPSIYPRDPEDSKLLSITKHETHSSPKIDSLRASHLCHAVAQWSLACGCLASRLCSVVWESRISRTCSGIVFRYISPVQSPTTRRASIPHPLNPTDPKHVWGSLFPSSGLASHKFPRRSAILCYIICYYIILCYVV